MKELRNKKNKIRNYYFETEKKGYSDRVKKVAALTLLVGGISSAVLVTGVNCASAATSVISTLSETTVPTEKIAITLWNEKGNASIIEVEKNSVEEFAIPEAEGFYFVGWNEAEDGSGIYHTSAELLTEDTTLYAIWGEQPDGKINVEKKTLWIGETFTLNLKNATGEVTFESEDPEIAQINKKGVVTATGEGKVVVKAIQYGKEYCCTVTVKTPSWKKAYGILLAELDDHKNMTFFLSNMDGKGEKELIVIDKISSLMDGKQKTTLGSYYDVDGKTGDKTISIYQYKKGKVVLVRSITFKKNMTIFKSKYSGRFMVLNMLEKKSTYNFIRFSEGKVKMKTESSYRGREFEIAAVNRATDGMIEKEFGYKVK